MVGEHPTQTTLPPDVLRPAWRAACIAYRKVRQTGLLDQPAWLAARAAVLALHPDLDEKAAGKVASDAIVFASVYHTAWLWRGVGTGRGLKMNTDGARGWFQHPLLRL